MTKNPYQNDYRDGVKHQLELCSKELLEFLKSVKPENEEIDYSLYVKWQKRLVALYGLPLSRNNWI